MECKPREARTRRWKRFVLFFGVLAASLLGLAPAALAASNTGGEASLILPDLNSVKFHGAGGGNLLAFGLIICALGLVFGLVIFFGLRNLPVHRSMRDISELIWQTCKTYLLQQGKFLMGLWVFIAIVIVVYFGFLSKPESGSTAARVVVILLFSILGILGSYGVAWFGIRVNNYANSRTAFASLKGKPYEIHAIPMRSGMSVGMMLISVELIIMLIILIWIPRDYAGPCFIGFAIGESLGAAALRIAGGIFTKIADIGSDLMKIVFNIKEDDARNPGVIADCTGDNAGDSVGPSADGFETYGVTGVALITFIILAVQSPPIQVSLLVWIFAMRVMMIISSGGSYFLNAAITKARYKNADKMNFEAPLTSLVWLTSIVSIILTFVVSYVLIGGSTRDRLQAIGKYWWMLSIIISMGTLAGALIPELVKVFTSTKSAHVKEVVASSREGGPSLDILSGFVAGNFSAYYIGFAIMVLMGIGYLVSTQGLGDIMLAPAVFAFGLVAFGFLGMGPVTIAVDSYGPVTDNAQSVYELSTIEQIPNVAAEIKAEFGFEPNFEVAKDNLEENDGAGNTFKATAKPVLIGTAVVGATTMIFSIIMALTDKLTTNLDKLSLLHPPFLLGHHHGRRDDLLVHRSGDPGSDHRRLPRGGVHQAQHQARLRRDQSLGRGQQEGRRYLHAVRAEGDDQHLPGGVLRHAGLRVPGAVLLHRLPDLHRRLRLVSRPSSWPTPAGPGTTPRRSWRRPEGEGHRTARGDGHRRHGGRPVQGHLLGGHEPGHQVHHAVRPAGRGVGGHYRQQSGQPRADLHPVRGVLPDLGDLRVALLLPHADQEDGGVATTEVSRRGPEGRRAAMVYRGRPPHRVRRAAFLWTVGLLVLALTVRDVRFCADNGAWQRRREGVKWQTLAAA